MKKTLLLLAFGVLLGTSGVWADHPGGTGIGLTLGGGGGTFGSGMAGFNFKLPSVPLFFTISANLSSYGAGFGGSGDFYFVDADLISEAEFNLDWFLGGGVFVSTFIGSDFYISLGGRLPIGLSWHINPKVELALAVIPSLGLSLNPLQFPVWFVGGELTIRYWM